MSEFEFDENEIEPEVLPGWRVTGFQNYYARADSVDITAETFLEYQDVPPAEPDEVKLVDIRICLANVSSADPFLELYKFKAWNIASFKVKFGLSQYIQSTAYGTYSLQVYIGDTMVASK